VDSGDVGGLDHLFPGGDLLGLELLGGDGGELDSVDIVPDLGHSVSKLQLLVGDGGELDSVDIVPDLGHSVSELQLIGGDGGGVSLGRKGVGGLDSVDIVPDMGHSDIELNFIPSPETVAGGTIFSGNWACTCSMYSSLSVIPLTTRFCQVTVTVS
jgi:hypothetical protein